MEAPKCRACGEKHWSSQPCRGTVPAERRDLVRTEDARQAARNAVARATLEAVTQPVRTGGLRRVEPPPIEDPIAVLRAELANLKARIERLEGRFLAEGSEGFDRRAYQREYMRRWRARKNSKEGVDKGGE